MSIPRGKAPIQVTVNDVKYSSLSSAAKALNVAPSRVRSAVMTFGVGTKLRFTPRITSKITQAEKNASGYTKGTFDKERTPVTCPEFVANVMRGIGETHGDAHTEPHDTIMGFADTKPEWQPDPKEIALAAELDDVLSRTMLDPGTHGITMPQMFQFLLRVAGLDSISETRLTRLMTGTTRLSFEISPEDTSNLANCIADHTPVLINLSPNGRVRCEIEIAD